MINVDKYYYRFNRIDFSDKNEVERAKQEIERIKTELDNNKVDFSNNHFFKNNKRVICSYKGNINEEIVLKCLTDKINKLCSVHFPDRTTIMQKLFDELPVLSRLQDFTIIKFDFKKYFYSISNEYVIKNILCNYKFSREDIDYLNMYTNYNKYSCAGLSLSNTFAELLARKFDEEAKCLFFEYGINFYSRYVDDGIIILDTFIKKDDALSLLNIAIEKVFKINYSGVKNKVELNMSKTLVINKRTLSSAKFSFLGYEFTMDKNIKGLINYKYGITDEKIQKYKNKFVFLIDKIYKEGNLKKMQLALKLSCSRIVYFNVKTKTWVSRGLIQNYCMLKDHCDNLDTKTQNFLENAYIDIFNSNSIKIPGYLWSHRYKLLKSLEKNKTIIFDPRIGVKLDDLKSIYLVFFGKMPSDPNNYNYLVIRILKELRIGY